MLHEIQFGDKKTYTDWGLLPVQQPVFNPPAVKTKILDIPGGDGIIDLTEAIAGYPAFKNREGSWSFLTPKRSEDFYPIYNEITQYLHGQVLQARLIDDDPGWYFEGRFWVNSMACNRLSGLITINYNVGPYKWSDRLTSEPWLWDPFSFINGVIGTSTYYDESTTPPTPVDSGNSDAFSHLEITTASAPLTFGPTGAAPQQPVFTASNNAVVLTVSGGGSTLKTQTLAVGVAASVPGLVLYRGGWLYNGRPVIVSAAVSGSSLPTKSVTGDPIHVTDAVGGAADALTVTVAKQNLHGYSKPWAGGYGKNIGKLSEATKGSNRSSTQTYSDTGVTIDADGSGTYGRTGYLIPVETGETYTVSYTAQLSGNADNRKIYYGSADGVWSTTSQDIYSYITLSSNTDPQSKSYTFEATTDVFFFGIYVTGNNTNVGSIEITNFQVEKASAATVFEPYENICPITGFTSAVVNVSETDDPEDGEDYPASWTNPVYGGSVDFKNGTVTTRPHYASYDGETLVGPWLSSMEEYAAGTSPTTGADVVDLGGTGTETSITAVPVTLLEGENYVKADTGGVTMTYKYQDSSASTGTLSLLFREGRL